MIRRPKWERETRKLLRRKGRGRKTAWRGVRNAICFGLVLLLGHFVLFVMPLVGNQTVNPALAGAWIGLPAGLCGAAFGMLCLGCLYGNRHLMTWAPAGLGASRRHDLRNRLPALAFWALAALCMALPVRYTQPSLPADSMFAPAALAFLAGAWFMGGKASGALLRLGCAAAIVVWILTALARLPIGTLNALVANAWLPSLPWSAANALAIQPVAAWIACALLAIESLHGWRRVWTANMPPPALDHPQAHADDEGEDREKLAPCGLETSAKDRGNIATHPTGLSAADDHDAGAGGWRRRLRDRFLSATERQLAVPGNATAHDWFRGTLWAALFGVLAIGIAVLARHLDALDLPGGLWRTIISLRLFAIFWLSSWAVTQAWPGRRSAFSWLTDPVARFGTRSLPRFAVFPFSLRVWLRAAAKEWCLRSLWLGALIAALCGFIAGLDLMETPVAGRIARSAFPWLLLLSLFPLHVIHRVSLAASGAVFRLHGALRVIPSLLFAFACPVACATGALATVGRDPSLAIQATAIAFACAALSLRLALARGENPCLDLHG